MESSIAQSIHKGFEKERWESKGNGCATSEDLFWKLDALQSFIRDLHWPDEEFREHLEQRLKLMACDMIESCIQRTDGAFQSWLKKTVTFISTDYIIPSEMCAMVNVILDAKNQSFKLCAVDGVDVVCTTIWFSICDFFLNNFCFGIHSINITQKSTIKLTKLWRVWTWDWSTNWCQF